MIIAEIGWNFMGDLGLAESMIEKAAKAGASHVKFQFWEERLLRPGPWDDDGRREIYKSAQLNADKMRQLNEIAEKYGVKAFYSVFSVEGLKLLKELGEVIIKIPSHEIHNLDLIKKALQNFKTVILSTGACTERELLDVGHLCADYDGELIVMHCVSSYPCDVAAMNLPRINTIKEIFPNATMGLSDHTQSVAVPATAVGFGVSVVEKHFTSDNELPGRDNQFALLPEEFGQMAAFFEEAKLACRYRGVDAQESEQDIINNYRGRWGGE